MKVLITYFSRSGQTRKVAEAIYDAIPPEKEIRELSQVNSLEEYDLAFVGFPIEKFGPGDNVQKWMGETCLGGNIALFVTHAAPKGHSDLEKWLDACNCAACSANILGRFDCQGELSEAFVKMASMVPDPLVQGFARERPNTLGHPTTDELDEAKTWAKKVLNEISRAI